MADNNVYISKMENLTETKPLLKKKVIKKKILIEEDIIIDNNTTNSTTDNISNNDNSTSFHTQYNVNTTVIEKNKIYNNDCLEYLSKLEDKIIDTIILDPPYYMVVKENWDNKWNNFEDYLKWMEDIIKSIERVAKYSCSLWIFGFPYQLSYIIPICEKYGFAYRQHITINKGMRSVAGRTSNKLKMFPVATEYLVYFHKESRHLIRDILRKKQKETKKNFTRN